MKTHEEIRKLSEKHLPKNHPLVKQVLGPSPKKFEDILKEEGIAVIE